MTLARQLMLAAALITMVGGLWIAPAPPPWWHLVLAVGVVATAHLLRQQFRIHAAVFYLAWGEAALVVGLYLVPAGWLPLVVATGFLVSVVIRAVHHQVPPPRTVPEVTGSLTLAAAVGAALSAGVAPAYQAALQLDVAGGLVLAGVAYLAVSIAAVQLFSSLRGRSAARELLRRNLRYKVPMAVGSVAIGLTAVAAADVDWRWVLALPVALWLLHSAYAYRIRGSERRRMWSALAEATRSLNQPDEERVVVAGIRGALEVFAVGRAEVELHGVGDERRVWVGEQPGEVRALAPAGGSSTAAAVGAVGAIGAGTAVPLLVDYDQIGLLRVRFPERGVPGDEERAALQAYADALAAALQDTATNERLHQVLARSAHEARHDPLTGLLNRAALLDHGDTAIQLVPPGAPVALLLVDVDHFREINDTLGHAAGDQVLVVTAERLREATEAYELLGRLGGDEFALLVADPVGERAPAEPARGAAAAEEVRRRAVRRGRELVRRLAEPATISGVPVSVEASVGVAVAPAGTADMAELLRRADAAVQQAKRGGGTVNWYDVVQDSASPDRPALLAELRTALAREDELVLAMQPVVELATGAPIKVEALVRWRHPRRGLLPPAEFVRAVEHSDLLAGFTEYVIDKALAAAAEWATRGPAVPVAVNLSARSLLDPRLPAAVGTLLARHRVPGQRLVLEITETVVTSEPPGIEEALASLRALGVQLAVDDFGTGYASLAFLTRVPLDEVKVDGQFVARMATSAEAAAIVRTTVELGQELGMAVVAEGVETAAQRRMLTKLGCPAGQGFYLATPTSADRIGPLLRRLTTAAADRGQVVPMNPVRAAQGDRPA